MTREEQIVEAGKTAAEGKEFSVLVNKQRRTMSAYEIGFIEGAEWADSHPAWVSVEEKEPPKTEDWSRPKFFLGLTKEGGIHKMFRMVDPTIGTDFEGELHLNVTHWMEITPPAEKGGEK